MDKGTVLAALIAALVTVIGWYVTYFYARRQEDRTRRLEIRLKYRQQQIEGLYGPLLSLIEQIFNIDRVQEKILKPPKGQGPYSPDKENQIKQFFWQRYFFPLHQEISSLLKTKLYLLEDAKIPASFTQYLKHATQETCQKEMWTELKIDTSHVPGTPWPNEFSDDVERTLDRLMQQVQTGVESLADSRQKIVHEKTQGPGRPQPGREMSV